MIAGALLTHSHPHFTVTTAGTHAIERQPMSRRTRAALESLGLAADHHRSRQVTQADLDEAVRIANGTDYGLAAAVWTRDLSTAHRMARAIRAGTVWVNCYDVFDAAAPFGGFKSSGIGRELGEKALDNYLEHKTVTVSLDD